MMSGDQQTISKWLLLLSNSLIICLSLRAALRLSVFSGMACMSELAEVGTVAAVQHADAYIDFLVYPHVFSADMSTWTSQWAASDS